MHPASISPVHDRITCLNIDEAGKQELTQFRITMLAFNYTEFTQSLPKYTSAPYDGHT